MQRATPRVWGPWFPVELTHKRPTKDEGTKESKTPIAPPRACPHPQLMCKGVHACVAEPGPELHPHSYLSQGGLPFAVHQGTKVCEREVGSAGGKRGLVPLLSEVGTRGSLLLLLALGNALLICKKDTVPEGGGRGPCQPPADHRARTQLAPGPLALPTEGSVGTTIARPSLCPGHRITAHPRPAIFRSLDMGPQMSVLTKITLSLSPVGAGS